MENRLIMVYLICDTALFTIWGTYKNNIPYPGTFISLERFNGEYISGYQMIIFFPHSISGSTTVLVKYLQEEIYIIIV